MRIYLIRHPQTAWNLEGRVQGHADEPLDEWGKSQAVELGNTFRTLGVGTVFSSDLSRARHAAESISNACEAKMILDSNLRERSFGAWEGELYHDLRRLLESQNVPDFDKSPPNGESVQMVWDRVVSFLPVVWDAEGDVVIVSHGGTCGMILAQLLEAPIETARAFRFPNAAITELSVIDRPKCHLIRYADVNHLSRASAPQIDAQTKA